MADKAATLKDTAKTLTLPDLGENYYWDIYRGAFEIDYLALRKKTRFFSREVDKRTLDFYELRNGKRVGVLSPEESISRAANSIAREFTQSRLWEGFYGVYEQKA